MCLFTPLKLKSSNQFGEWVSSDKNIIRMENDTRIARVLGTKTSHVTLTHSLHSAAPLQIKLLPIETIIVQPYTKPLTNAEGAISEIAIVLQGENMVRKNNLVNLNFKLILSLTFERCVIFYLYKYFVLPVRWLELPPRLVENHHELPVHLQIRLHESHDGSSIVARVRNIALFQLVDRCLFINAI